MSYATVQSAVATLIKKVSGYTARNVTEGDYRIFTKGLRKGVVLRKGTSNSQRLAVTAGTSYPVRSDHVVNIEVYVPYRTAAKDTRDSLIAETNSILAELRKWPDLNGTAGVKLSGPGDLSEPEEGQFAGSGWTFWRQIITYPVAEVETVTVGT